MSSARNISILILCLWFCAGCSSSDSDDPGRPPTENISVTAVDSEGNELGLNYLQWGFLDIDGNVANWTDIPCNVEDVSEQCQSIVIGFEADGEIRVEGVSEADAPDRCFLDLTGSEDFIANPTEKQDVVLHLLEPHFSCF